MTDLHEVNFRSKPNANCTIIVQQHLALEQFLFQHHTIVLTRKDSDDIRLLGSNNLTFVGNSGVSINEKGRHKFSS